MKTEVMLGYEQVIEFRGLKLPFKAFRAGNLNQRKTSDHLVEVYQNSFMIASKRIPWNNFSGSPKSYPDYALEAVLEDAAVKLISSSVWDLDCSLRNGLQSEKDLNLLRAASDLANRRGSATMVKKLGARIKKIEKEQKL